LSIFWIHGETTARFVEGYKQIAEGCNIPWRENADLDLMQLVRDWLANKHEPYWLMVIDNVDDKDTLFAVNHSTGKSLLEYVDANFYDYISFFI
jgi:hypothetical protein